MICCRPELGRVLNLNMFLIPTTNGSVAPGIQVFKTDSTFYTNYFYFYKL